MGGGSLAECPRHNHVHRWCEERILATGCRQLPLRREPGCRAQPLHCTVYPSFPTTVARLHPSFAACFTRRQVPYATQRRCKWHGGGGVCPPTFRTRQAGGGAPEPHACGCWRAGGQRAGFWRRVRLAASSPSGVPYEPIPDKAASKLWGWGARPHGGCRGWLP